MVAGIRETMRDPRVRTNHEQEIAVVHILRSVTGLAAKHMAVNPEVAGFLLRQRVEGIARTECAQERTGISAASVVALAATTIERHALAAMPVDEISHPLGDFGDRHLPVDRIKPAVGATAQWSGEPVLVVRIVRDARRFVAEIPLRFWAGTVASDLLDVSLVDQGETGASLSNDRCVDYVRGAGTDLEGNCRKSKPGGNLPPIKKRLIWA